MCGGGGGGYATGYNHCFTASDHVGCQFSHSTSVEIISDSTTGQLALAAFVICGVATPLAGAICSVAAAIVGNEIVGWPLMPLGDCLEVGLNYFVIPYAKTISCSVET